MSSSLVLFSLLSALLTLVFSEEGFSYTNTATYDEIFNDGLDAYNEERWGDAVRLIEQSLADFKHEKSVHLQCRIRCKDDHEESETDRGIKNLEVRFMSYSIKMRLCFEACKKKYLGKRSRVSRHIRDTFESRLPYGYLQLAYYKTGQNLKAARAAQTLLDVSPDDETMLTNMVFYRKLAEIGDMELTSMEPSVHQDAFLRGVNLYSDDKWEEAIASIEEAVAEYNKSYKNCYAECENELDLARLAPRAGLFGHYVYLLQCQSRCPQKLATIDSSIRTNYFAYHFHYLQFAYYKVGKLEEALKNAKTYLLLDPNDGIMKTNVQFYEGEKELQGKVVRARQDAMYINNMNRLTSKLLHQAEGFLDEDLENFFNTDDSTDDKEWVKDIFGENAVVDEVAAKVESKSEEKTTKESEKPAEGKIEHVYKKPWNAEIVNKDKFKGSQIVMVEKDLNVTESPRVVIDNFISERECTLLQELADSLAGIGDGYQGKKHHFTDMEEFEGVNIVNASRPFWTALQAVLTGKTDAEKVELYLNASEKMRQFTEGYFNLPNLYFSYTHLVCRTALGKEGDDKLRLSHPIHSDNCLLHKDGPGSCPKQYPAYTWRDYSAILYLNENFAGGHFIFANPNGTVQATVKPKCGRLVAFSAGYENLHGVLGVYEGRRCALPVWFTLSKDHKEQQRDEAWQTLRVSKMIKDAEEEQKGEHIDL